MKAFITGAAGFVGYALASRFKTEMEVLGTLKGAEQASDIDGTDWSTIVHDWEQAYEPLPMLKADIFIHAAFQGPITERLAGNELMAVNAVHAARKLSVKRLILLSSGSVYREQSDAIVEETPALPIDGSAPYPASLQKIEKTFIGAFPDIPVVVVRLFHPYGPREPKDRLVSRLAESIRQGKPVPLRKSLRGVYEGPAINPIFVDDVAEMIFRISMVPDLPVGPTLINLGGKEKVTVRELCGMIASGLGLECKFSEAEDASPAADLVSYPRRASGLAGCEPRTTLREGIRATLGGSQGP